MPKTIRNVYDKAVSFDNILMAHKKARRGKREKKDVIIFELNLESEILRLEEQLRYGKYKPGKYNSFKVYEPKERVIMASPYTDRVVHQWYVENFIKPYFVPQFILTSYAGIENRGMHKASKDVQRAMRQAKSKWKEYYILKMDVTKYFQNIDKRILWDILLDLEDEPDKIAEIFNIITKTSIHDIDEQFRLEDAQMTIFDFI